MPATTQIVFDLTPGGLAEAQAELDRIRELFERRDAPAGQRPAGEIVYRNCGENSRSRKVLELLPDSQDNALTFEELAAEIPMDRAEPGTPGTRGSVRAAYRNVKRVESRLQKSGEIDRPVILVDDSAYAIEGANRYYLRPDDKAAIEELSNGRDPTKGEDDPAVSRTVSPTRQI